MNDYLPFVTIDTWTLIFMWVNLLILFLLMKKFLFKPVKNILDQRDNEIKTIYEKADTALENATKLEKDYTQKLAETNAEARLILDSAYKKADVQTEKLIAEAHTEASAILQKADVQIEAEQKQAMNKIKGDISSMAVSIAEKVIEKEINESDYTTLVEKFIDEMGDVS